MQTGDKVHVQGTVTDIVGSNVLMVTDDGREYWFIDKHVEVTKAAPPPVEPPVEVPPEEPPTQLPVQ
jgi:hypothetical protein